MDVAATTTTTMPIQSETKRVKFAAVDEVIEVDDDDDEPKEAIERNTRTELEMNAAVAQFEELDLAAGKPTVLVLAYQTLADAFPGLTEESLRGAVHDFATFRYDGNLRVHGEAEENNINEDDVYEIFNIFFHHKFWSWSVIEKRIFKEMLEMKCAELDERTKTKLVHALEEYLYEHPGLQMIGQGAKCVES
jgi:hypothetical protein